MVGGVVWSKYQYAQRMTVTSESDLPCCQLLSTAVARPKLAASVEVSEGPLSCSDLHSPIQQNAKLVGESKRNAQVMNDRRVLLEKKVELQSLVAKLDKELQELQTDIDELRSQMNKIEEANPDGGAEYIKLSKQHKFSMDKKETKQQELTAHKARLDAVERDLVPCKWFWLVRCGSVADIGCCQ